jgi:hypothetical protein
MHFMNTLFGFCQDSANDWGKHMNQILFLITVALVPLLFVGQISASTGTFIIVKNEVNLQRKSGGTELAKVGSTLSVGDTVISGNDSRAKIAMQDRNIITVLPNSKLVIEEYKSSDKDRNVKLSLLEGKVRNDVKEKYDNDKNKFQIRTPTAVAGVRGTKFITSYQPETKVTEVITLKGEVLVTKFELNKTTALGTVKVEQGKKATFNDDAAPPAEPVKIPKAELRNADNETVTKKEPKASEGSGSTRGTNKPPPPPPPPRPPTSPTEGITQPGQLPPFLINNPSTNLPGKVKPVLTAPN